MTPLARHYALFVWHPVIPAADLMNVEVFSIRYRLRTPPAVVAAIPAPPLELLPCRNQPIGTPLPRWHSQPFFVTTMYRTDPRTRRLSTCPLRDSAFFSALSLSEYAPWKHARVPHFIRQAPPDALPEDQTGSLRGELLRDTPRKARF
jgi:hypothetical protein